MRISLSSMREPRFSTAEPRAKMFAGLSALSPYALFLLSSRSRTPFATAVIFSALVISRLLRQCVPFHLLGLIR